MKTTNAKPMIDIIHEYADPIINHIKGEYKERYGQMEEDYNKLKIEHEILKGKLEVYERLTHLIPILRKEGEEK